MKKGVRESDNVWSERGVRIANEKDNCWIGKRIGMD